MGLKSAMLPPSSCPFFFDPVALLAEACSEFVCEFDTELPAGWETPIVVLFLN